MVSASDRAEPLAEAALVGGRYRLHEQLGIGGVAVVYAATDTGTGERVALKRLHLNEAEARNLERAAQLFEREYHTLSELAHPRIVSVHDYAIDPDGPYYTMELLDGGDLQQLAPLEWRQVCAIGVDICSALSLVHSRRFVHRDVTTRNVRCTGDGLAKLIDFGVMGQMGQPRYLVGTPAFCAPEVVDRRALDGRVDLYALGATLYYALTGSHAYPARGFASLRALWCNPVIPPSQRVPDIPAELDALILDLLRRDSATRPASAGEVLERLAGIGGMTGDEQAVVAQAYLTTPNLVGRKRRLGRIRRAAQQAHGARGRSLVIKGPEGVGRSRFLDASTLVAQTAGLSVLRADADDAGPYGVARALGRQLLSVEPALAMRTAMPLAATLGHLLPDLATHAPNAELEVFKDASQQRSGLQAALQQWLLAVAKRKPLLIAVDDLHRVDEPSAAVLALLTRQLPSAALVLLASVQSGRQTGTPAAQQFVQAATETIVLRPLRLAGTRSLLSSLFGDVPNLELLADRLQALTHGNPRDIMQLAQHLLERGALRYRAGAWSLPEQIDPSDLPADVAEAMRQSVAALEADALELARCFALEPELRFSFDDCLMLCAHGDTGRGQRALDDLLEHGLLKSAGEGFSLARAAWADALLEGCTQQQALHLRLSRVFERRGNADFRVAAHRLRGGDHGRGLDLLIAHSEQSQQVTEMSPGALLHYVNALPTDWLGTYTEAIAVCNRLGRPRRDTYVLQRRPTVLISLLSVRDRQHVDAVLEQLVRWSGLADWEALDQVQDPKARLQQALSQAMARYQQAPATERVLDPTAAIRELARVLIRSAGTIAATLDFAYLDSLPSLGPLVPLSPAIEVTDTLVRGIRARMTGQPEALELYGHVLELTSGADGGGLVGSHLKMLRLGVRSGLGLLQANLGWSACLEHAEACERDGWYRLNGLQIRALYHLWQGDVAAADGCRREVERLRIQDAPYRVHEGIHLLSEVTVHALCDDLTRIKQTLREIEALAEQHRNWQPVRDFGLASLHRMRGEHAQAQVLVQKALSRTLAGQHPIWPNLAGAQLRSLCQQGRVQEARELGEGYLDAAKQAGLGVPVNGIRLPLAEALCRSGGGALAQQLADKAIAQLQELGTGGLNLGLAYETRARVALAQQDWEALTHFQRACRESYYAHQNPVLMARFEGLRRDAKRAKALGLRSASAEVVSRVTDMDLAAQLDTCANAVDRAVCVLTQLVRRSGAQRGTLYLLSEGKLRRATDLGPPAPPSLDAVAQAHLDAELAANGHTRTQGASPSMARSGVDGDTETTLDTDTTGSGDIDTRLGTAIEGVQLGTGRYHAVVLTHTWERGAQVTGVAMLGVPEDGTFEYPASLALILSQRLHQAGDASTPTGP